MNTATKELEIIQTAERLRELGVPDSLNRWLKMTPETLLANQRARAKINKQHADGAPVRFERKSRSTISAGHAANLDDAGKVLLKEVSKAAREKKIARLRDLKERTSMSKTNVGPKEAQLRAARASDGTDTESTKPAGNVATDPKETKVRTKTTTKKADAKAKAKTAARTPVKGKTTKAKPASAKTAAKPVGDGPRPGSKLAIIRDLLSRPEGCTTKQVLEACQWPAVSMPQQARALGVTLKKEKVDGVTVYRAA